MKKLILTSIVAFMAFFTFTACSSNNEKVVAENAISTVDSFTLKYEREKEIREKNKAISKSQEIPTGEKTFRELLHFILTQGATIYGGKGKQYTFFDTKGNRHAYLAIKFDSSGSKYVDTGSNYKIIVYGYYKGIKDQEHFFPYAIDDSSVYCNILELDDTWQDFEAVKFGYEEFLAKVSGYSDNKTGYNENTKTLSQSRESTYKKEAETGYKANSTAAK